MHYLDQRGLDDPAFNPPNADNRMLDLRTVVWLVRPTIANTQRVAAQVRSMRSAAAPAGSRCVRRAQAALGLAGSSRGAEASH